jgi:hypothetical protein
VNYLTEKKTNEAIIRVKRKSLNLSLLVFSNDFQVCFFSSLFLIISLNNKAVTVTCVQPKATAHFFRPLQSFVRRRGSQTDKWTRLFKKISFLKIRIQFNLTHCRKWKFEVRNNLKPSIGNVIFKMYAWKFAINFSLILFQVS